MKKVDMREWVEALEGMADVKLKKWRKEPIFENGEALQLRWQFEQAHIILDIFWEDGKESIHFQYHAPRASHRFEWSGLNEKTFNKVVDRIGNLAQITMHPPIDPEFDM